MKTKALRPGDSSFNWQTEELHGHFVPLVSNAVMKIKARYSKQDITLKYEIVTRPEKLDR